MRKLRPIRKRAAADGISFRVVEGAELDAVMPRLAEISREWLESVHGGEKGFSLGFFDEGYMRNFPVAVAEKEGAIFAFCNLWLGGDGSELSVDLMRYGKDAPRDRKRKFPLRPLLAALSAWELRCDRLSVRLTLPLGDHPETEVKLLVANFAFLTATSLLSPQKCDCAIRVADVRRAKLYGSISLSCASALDCALRCLSAAKKAKGANRA